ncbi:DUF1836 domain-containing protein [Vaginisenegalia massiliensis]|uniref:DUF1836 domain-containing protein n=1 Tax=Vaginisenegalia massiliensis TaxID=2058294 RepID=UPI000F534907|nr:DUF1836 domain-containing protein [Vaginisenegalia massiliensis]
MDRIQELQHFVCPKWEDLPKQSLFSKEVIQYINQELAPLLIDSKGLTVTMIQNYSKWGVMPKIEGRKYSRQHIAVLITIVLYKQVLNIESVHQGMALQLRMMPLEEAYNILAESITQSIQSIFQNFDNQPGLILPQQAINPKAEGISVISTALALKILGTLIIDLKGFDHLGDENE